MSSILWGREEIRDREGNLYIWSMLENCLIKCPVEKLNNKKEQLNSENLLLLTEECDYET